MSTLIDELLEAANHLDIAQRYRVADRLRQRAALVRELVQRCEDSMSDEAWWWMERIRALTGPIPAAETAPTERKP